MTNRRKFIQQTALGFAGLTVSQYALSNILVQKKKEKLGVALVGLGYYSTDLLAPALQLNTKMLLSRNCHRNSGKSGKVETTSQHS